MTAGAAAVTMICRSPFIGPGPGRAAIQRKKAEWMVISPKSEFPRAAVGAVVIREGRVLLVRRANPPQRGKWAIPGGSVEPGETLRAAAEREVAEETGLKIKAGAPIHVFDLIERDERGSLRFHYVIVDVTAEYLSGEIAPADDAREAGWFTPEAAEKLDLSSSTRGLLRKIGFSS